MAQRDWLSLSEIARRWSAETGESAGALERDLEDWFTEFVEHPASRHPGSPGHEGDTTNVLMGLLGGRHLQRETLAIYCEEKGLDKPRFWFAEDADDPEEAEDAEPPPASLPPDDGSGWAVAARGVEAEPSESAAAAPRSPAGGPDPWPEASRAWQAAGDGPPDAIAQDGALTEALGPLRRRRAVRLAGGLALGLALLATGFVLGQGGGGRPQAVSPSAAPDEAASALVGSLRSDLVTARRQIDNLDAALAASETEVKQLTRDLLATRQSLVAARAAPPREGGAPEPASAREIADLKAQLADARQRLASLSEAGEASQSEAVKRSLVQAATSASAQAMSFKAELQQARRRIADLEKVAQAAEGEADRLAGALHEARLSHEAALRDAAEQAQSARQRLILAAEIASTQAALNKRDLAAAQARLAGAAAEAKAAKAEAARLAGELAETRRLRPAGPATAGIDPALRDKILAAQAASSQAAKLGQDLDAAKRWIADLESGAKADKAEAAALADQLAELRRAQAASADSLEKARAEAVAREQELDQAKRRLARLEATPQTPDKGAEPPAQQAARPSRQPLDLLESGRAGRPADQTARGPSAALATSPSEKSRESLGDAAAEPIDVDSLVGDPGRFDAHQVMVTGSLLRLLQHYRLQSKSGLKTLVVDVEGLHRDQFERLQQAIASAGLIGSVRAQISGKVERGTAQAFRLVASDVRLVD